MLNSRVPYVVPLGVAAALPDADHANTYMAVVGSQGYWLVDCADSPIRRLQRAGLDPLTVQGVLITHFHPDHVYGLPAYLLGLFMLSSIKEHTWTAPLCFYAHPEVLEQIQALIAVFSSQSWLDELPLAFKPVPPGVGAHVTEDEDFSITAAPTQHAVTSIAVRFDLRGTERAFTYSSDTLPCAAVETLAHRSTLLVHEATDSDNGHTRPGAAGALAARADVERLVLIHYRTAPGSMTHALREATKTFGESVELAQAFKRYTW